MPPGLALVPCKPNEIQQVVIDLLKSATHAVEHRGGPVGRPRILVRTRRQLKELRL